MGKRTKRERKFQASGGVKSRIEKGTITKKGKLRKRKKHPGSSDGGGKNEQHHGLANDASPRRDHPDDFLGRENLADLDVDNFFKVMVDNMDAGAEGDDGEEEQSSSSSEGEQGKNVMDTNTAARSKGKATMLSASGSGSDSTSSDSSDEDEEDVDRAEARMKDAMKKIETADPEFHSFLQENEQSLLEFGDAKRQRSDDSDDDHSSSSDDDDNVEDQEELDRDDDNEVNGRTSSEDGILLTPKVLKSLVQGTFASHGIKSLKKLVGAYRSACHLADSTDDSVKARPGETGTTYVIDSSTVFDQLMVLCLNRFHEEFRYHLLDEDESDEGNEEKKKDEEEDPLVDNKPLSPKLLERSEKWADVKPIIVSFFRSTLHVMSEAKEPELQAFILKALSKYVRYLSPFQLVAEAMLKSLTSLWSAPLDSSEDYQVVRLNAFLRIRQLAVTQPFPFVEDCLKRTYLAYARRAKFGNASSITTALPTLTFMGNCIVELYSLDYHSSYQHAFAYIRQLALLLRSAMQKRTPEAVQQVYCWQYVHSLKLWVAVLASAAPTDDGALMRSLIYPLTEVILGTARLSPSPRNLPLRFQCIRLVQQLAAAAEVFIPTTSLLFDCLDMKEWYLKPKKSRPNSNSRGMQMHLLLKLPKVDYLRTHEQLEAGMSEFFLLLQREIELYRYSAGFPEYAIGIVQRVRKFSKEVRNPRWRAFARGCIDTAERYSAFAIEERSKLEEAPKDVKRLECIRPVSAPDMRERHEASIQKEQKSLQVVPSRSGGKDNDSVEDSNRRKEQRGNKKRMKGKDATPAENSASSPKKQKKKRGGGVSNSSRNDDTATAADNDKSAGDKAEVVMELQDDVREGIDWSDDEEE